MCFLSFCLSKEFYVDFVKDIFTAYRILDWQEFYFSIWKISFLSYVLHKL